MSKVVFQGCENPFFDKPWLCLSDTRHFRHFRLFQASEDQSPCFSLYRMQTRHFRRSRQNPCFRKGAKPTVSQNHRFNNPESYPRPFLGREYTPPRRNDYMNHSLRIFFFCNDRTSLHRFYVMTLTSCQKWSLVDSSLNFVLQMRRPSVNHM